MLSFREASTGVHVNKTEQQPSKPIRRKTYARPSLVKGPVIAAMFIVVWDIFAAEHRDKPPSLDKGG